MTWYLTSPGNLSREENLEEGARESWEVPGAEGTTEGDLEGKSKVVPVVTGSIRAVTPKLED